MVVAGHDLKFFTPLLDYLRLQPDLEVRLDQWAALGQHDPAVSRELADWADVVICEWCGPNAVWYSKHKRRGSRLLVRLHRFELESPYPGQVKIGGREPGDLREQALRAAVPGAHRLAGGEGSDRAQRASTSAQLDRPKLDGARFHLGMIGIVPSRKRLDLALDVLEELRREDDRYLLFIKSGMPWEHWWVWKNPAEREHYATALRRVQRSPLLRGAVVFDDAGPDVGGLAAPGRLRALHQRRRELPRRRRPRGWRPGRCRCSGTGPAPRPSTTRRWIHDTPADMAAAIGALDEEALAAGGRRRARPGQGRVQPAARVRGLARPADQGPRPGGPGPVLELLGSG